MATTLASHPTLRSFEYWVYSYRATWRGSLVNGILSPVLFLAAMGVGLGTMVDGGSDARDTLDGVSYLVFLAPGLLAANAMQVAVGESTYPVMGAIKWYKSYFAMIATPLRVVDVLLGHLLWIAVRVTMVSAIFLIVMAAFDTTESWLTLLALPAAALTGLAFAAPIMAFAATQQRDTGFNALYRFGVVPLFLFSGTFFPIDQLPIVFEYAAYATPLWHGVELCRDLVVGDAGLLASLGHVAYLVALVVAGVVIGARTFRSRLVT